jgi:predicted Holliday junction resolvase-like endonuclease
MMSLFEEYQAFRKILAVCPCGKLHRVSDLLLKSKAEIKEETWLDEFDIESSKLLAEEQAFEEQKEKLRQVEIEKGRREAEKAFYKAVCPSLRKLKLNPFDLKPILHPIDFIAFNGMTNEESISDIRLLAREQCAILAPIRKQIKRAVETKKYDWQVARVNDNGDISME